MKWPLSPLRCELQQRGCQTLIARFAENSLQAEPIPTLFEDSTHQLWFLNNRRQVLKCLTIDPAVHPFWSGVKQLFGYDLSHHLDDLVAVSARLQSWSPLRIPRVLQTERACDHTPAYQLIEGLVGERAFDNEAKPSWVLDLAVHLVKLHQQTSVRWGRFVDPQLPLAEWGPRFVDVVKRLLTHQAFNDLPHYQTWLSQLEQLKTVQIEVAVPVMLDLRWDQFLTDGERLTALVDLDAFVWAPRELDLVMLEYLLTDHQAWLFKRAYQQHHAWPDLADLRVPYRLWLFCLQVLGETDMQRWMNAPARFELVSS